eukprot:Rhum_TRINITY_DN14705_c17_g1::Rhum_TRINITY_DN14705_c17_g1_i1::g.112291::m.112291/K09584/PDIA6, TXNDC7; protein disulfide-isomerase A6
MVRPAMMAAVLATACLATPAAALFSKNSAVQNLDPAGLNKVLSSDSFLLLEFFAPWCGHCRNLVPEMEKAAKALKGTIVVGAVDADQHKELGGQYQVKGFPTLMFFGLDRKKPLQYNGGRTAKDLVQYAMREATKAVDARLGGKKQSGGGGGGGGGGSGPHRDEEYLHVSEVLRVARRDLLVEQEKVREGDEERARMDRDLAELRKQLEVYESCGPGAAVQDMRGALASMREKVVEREEAVGELRDRLNQADEDLDTVLQFAESLKQLALSLGVSQEEILQLANKVDTAQRKASELEELEEKVRVRDKEIELLERERLHWKKQVRLQALPRLEQAQRMGLTPEQLATLSEITDRMRGSGLSDVQALVGMHTGEDDALFSQTRHAELERKLETAREKNEALTEMHQRLRTLFMDVCKERDERRLLTNLAAPAGEEDYMRQLIAQAVAGGSASAADPEQLQAMVAQLAAAAQGAAAAAAAAAQQQQQPPAASTEASSESPQAKEKEKEKAGSVSLVQQVAQ